MNRGCGASHAGVPCRLGDGGCGGGGSGGGGSGCDSWVQLCGYHGIAAQVNCESKLKFQRFIILQLQVLAINSRLIHLSRQRRRRKRKRQGLRFGAQGFGLFRIVHLHPPTTAVWFCE
jgi:hypothetical protein